MGKDRVWFERRWLGVVPIRWQGAGVLAGTVLGIIGFTQGADWFDGRHFPAELSALCRWSALILAGMFVVIVLTRTDFRPPKR